MVLRLQRLKYFFHTLRDFLFSPSSRRFAHINPIEKHSEFFRVTSEGKTIKTQCQTWLKGSQILIHCRETFCHLLAPLPVGEVRSNSMNVFSLKTSST